MTSIHDLYQQHSRAVFRFALGLCGDRHLANDLVAETFVRALVASSRIETETVLGYLFTIARRLYLKEWHRRERHVEMSDEFGASTPGPEQQAIDAQTLANTLAALQALPETDRTALLMRAQDEVPYQDIALALDISLSSAKVKVLRARLKLAQTLKEDLS